MQVIIYYNTTLYTRVGLLLFLWSSNLVSQKQQMLYFVCNVVVFLPLTDRASTTPSNIRGCQSGTWSQRGVPRSTGHIMVTTRYSDQQGSKSRQKFMRPCKQWHRPITKRFIKLLYSISRAASIDSDCCHLPTTSVLSNKSDKYVPTSFDQQLFQISQGHTSYKNKEN